VKIQIVSFVCVCVQEKQSVTASMYLSSAITLGPWDLCFKQALQFQKPKTKGRQIWPPPWAAKGPVTPQGWGAWRYPGRHDGPWRISSSSGGGQRDQWASHCVSFHSYVRRSTAENVTSSHLFHSRDGSWKIQQWEETTTATSTDNRRNIIGNKTPACVGWPFTARPRLGHSFSRSLTF